MGVLALNEGKQYVGQNAISGRTVYMTAIYGQTVSGTQIAATSTLGALQQDSGIARVSVVLGAINSSGILVVPSFILLAGSGGHSNVQAVVMASAAAAGVGLFAWDLPATYDMSSSGAQIVTVAMNWFFKNPGE